MYHTTRYEDQISVSDFLKNYVDVPTFLGACKACPNYGRYWCCPPYSFDVIQYWQKYQTLKILACKITFSQESLARTYAKEQYQEILDAVMIPEKEKLSQELLLAEQAHPGSVSLAAGSCRLCPGGCTNPDAPCRYPDKMRYSIESLGGNVALAAKNLLGVELKWAKDGCLPPYLLLTAGLLLP